MSGIEKAAQLGVNIGPVHGVLVGVKEGQALLEVGSGRSKPSLEEEG